MGIFDGTGTVGGILGMGIFDDTGTAGGIIGIFDDNGIIGLAIVGFDIDIGIIGLDIGIADGDIDIVGDRIDIVGDRIDIVGDRIDIVGDCVDMFGGDTNIGEGIFVVIGDDILVDIDVRCVGDAIGSFRTDSFDDIRKDVESGGDRASGSVV